MDEIIDKSLIAEAVIDTKERILNALLQQEQREKELQAQVQQMADKLIEIGRGIEKRDGRTRTILQAINHGWTIAWSEIKKIWE
jgi:hypothetical protein